MKTVRILHDPVEHARRYLYLREAQSLGQNMGARVQGVCQWALGEDGQSWCCYFAIGFILDTCFGGESPFPRTQDINGSTVSALAHAKKEGWVCDLEDLEPGDLVFNVNADGKPHHIAIYTGAAKVKPSATHFACVGGNTSEDGASNNGDRVAEHDVSKKNKVGVKYPREFQK